MRLTAPLGPQVAGPTPTGVLVHWIAKTVVSMQTEMMEAAYSKSSPVESINMFTVFGPGLESFLALMIGYRPTATGTLGSSRGPKKPFRLGAFAAPRTRAMIEILEKRIELEDDQSHVFGGSLAVIYGVLILK
jgi:hypothetical protein